jgi:hypothetical protein
MDRPIETLSIGGSCLLALFMGVFLYSGGASPAPTCLGGVLGQGTPCPYLSRRCSRAGQALPLLVAEVFAGRARPAPTLSWNPINFRLLLVNYKDPQHLELGDALMNPPVAGSLQLLLFVESVMLFFRMRQRLRTGDEPSES